MAGAWPLGPEPRDTAEEPPRAVLVAVAPGNRPDEGAPGTQTSLREPSCATPSPAACAS
jgi:hypothetical protein